MTAHVTNVEIPRDRWLRPLVIPPGGGNPTPYTRVSTLAKTLDEQSGLIAWKARKTAEGLVRRPDLLTRVAGTLAKGDADADRATKSALNKVCEEACEAAGASRGSSAGTGFHELTEALDRGQPPLFVTAEDQARLDAYAAATEGYEPLDIECFVVNDTVMAAGTFDRLYRCPDGRVRTADLKTGKSEVDYPASTTIQIAVYANGQRYDPATGDRSPLHPDLDLTTGLLIHLPATGGCQVVPLDIEAGWRAARVAAEVYQIRKWRAADWKRVQ